MKRITLIVLSAISIGCVAQTTDESVIFHRIESIYQAKTEIMDKIWPAVKDSAYSIPFIYYTDTSSYVINPRQKFITEFEPILKYQKPGLHIYRTHGRLDSLPFHMEVRISDVTTDFNYNFPYGKVSSIETVKKITEVDIPSWMGMVLHELFHGYQFRHPAFWKHAFDTKLIFAPINDSLQSYYQKYDWFRESIDKENALMLQAIAQQDLRLRKDLVRKMLSLRDERRKQASNKINRPIEYYERSFETMEGTARYIELSVITNFHKLKVPNALRKSDPNYSALTAGPMQEPEWAYKTEVSQSYTYAMGYNMAKLLDALGLEFKTKLFKTPALTLEDILREGIN